MATSFFVLNPKNRMPKRIPKLGVLGMVEVLPLCPCKTKVASHLISKPTSAILSPEGDFPMSDCYECANSTGWGVCQHCNGKDPKGELLGEDSNSTSTYDPDTIPFKTPPTFADRHSKTIELCAAFVILTIILYFAGTYYYSRPSLTERIRSDFYQMYEESIKTPTSDDYKNYRLMTLKYLLFSSKGMDFYGIFVNEYNKTLLDNNWTQREIDELTYCQSARYQLNVWDIFERIEIAALTQGIVPSKLSKETLTECIVSSARYIATKHWSYSFEDHKRKI
jgi:hypothetical protein